MKYGHGRIDRNILMLVKNLQSTRGTPGRIMCGEDDMTCTPEHAERTASAIDGATLLIMKDLGHSPMSENPVAFRPYFKEALEKMRLPHVQLAEA